MSKETESRTVNATKVLTMKDIQYVILDLLESLDFMSCNNTVSQVKDFNALVKRILCPFTET